MSFTDLHTLLSTSRHSVQAVAAEPSGKVEGRLHSTSISGDRVTPTSSKIDEMVHFQLYSTVCERRSEFCIYFYKPLLFPRFFSYASRRTTNFCLQFSRPRLKHAVFRRLWRWICGENRQNCCSLKAPADMHLTRVHYI